MEVDEVQKQVCKFQRVSSNGSTTTTDNNSSNPYKLATSRGNLDVLNHVNDGRGVARFSGWPSSRIVRVSRASGGKDRHSKVLTSKGLRDRRVRLSVGTAIQFYDLQDRLGFDQPSKAVEWLLNAASSSIDELPDLDVPIPGVSMSDCHHEHQMQTENELMVKRNNLDSNNIVADHEAKLKLKSKSKSPSCSSTSETSKGESELSLSRSENRAKARERARLLAMKKEKEKEKEIDSSRVTVLDQLNNISDTSSFTDLLTGRCQMECLFNRPVQASPQLLQLPHFNVSTGDNLHHFSFHDGLLPPVTPVGGTGGGERHHLNFSTPGGSVVSPGGFTRGTLQSNSILPHYHHLQRFQSSFVDGSMSANLPLFIVPNAAVDNFPTTGGYNSSCGGGEDGGGRHSDHQKEKLRN